MVSSCALLFSSNALARDVVQSACTIKHDSESVVQSNTMDTSVYNTILYIIYEGFLYIG